MDRWLQVDPANDDAIVAATERLRAEMTHWVTANDRPVDCEVVAYVVALRARYGDDGELDRWRDADLTTLLTETAPAMAVFDDDDERDRVVPGLAAMVDFLADQQLLTSDSDEPPSLHQRLAALAEPFVEAMNDPSRRSPAAAMADAMRAEGVDLTDEDAVDAWMQQRGETPTPVPSNASSTLPAPAVDEAALAEQANATVLLTQLHALMDYVGDGGLTLTADDELGDADARALAERLGTTDHEGLRATFRLAVDAGFLDDDDERLQAVGEAREALAERPLTAWRVAVQTLLNDGILSSGWSEPPRLAEWFDESIADVLVSVWAAGGPVELATVAQATVDDVQRAYQLDEPPDHEVADHVAWLAERLEWIGLVELDVPRATTDTPRRVTQGTFADATMTVTPLGKWALQPAAERLGFTVARAGDLAGVDAETLLGRIADWDPSAVEGELDAWIRARGDTAAAPELVAALQATDDTAQREIGLTGLWRLGNDAEATVRNLGLDPALRPYAIAWLVERGLASPDELTPEGVAAATMETLAASLVSGATSDQLAEMLLDPAPTADRAAALVSELWRVDTPHAETVLEALAAASNEAIADAARGGLAKHRGSD